MKRLALIAVALVFYTACSHDTPPGQPPLANLDIASFKQQFNAAPGVRVLLLLSPT